MVRVLCNFLWDSLRSLKVSRALHGQGPWYISINRTNQSVKQALSQDFSNLRKDGTPKSGPSGCNQSRLQFENYSSLIWDTLEMMLFTKYLIKWKRIGRISCNFWYWFNLKFSIELEKKNRCYTCSMPLYSVILTASYDMKQKIKQKKL